MASLFGKIRAALARTREGIAERVQDILAGGRRIDVAALEELEEALLAADVGVKTTSILLERLAARARAPGGEAVPPIELLREEVRRVLASEHADAPAAGASGATGVSGASDAAGTSDARPGPRVVLVVGVNGTGKTTTIGKLAARWTKEGRRVLLAAADTFRAAAGDQLGIWAERAGVEVVRGRPGADPASVAHDALARALAREADVLLVDTAGRLQTKSNLMAELAKIARVLGKLVPGAPHEALLVLDASTGQNALSQARAFGADVGVTGIVLTKIDGTAKGGIVLAIAEELGVPVRYLGVGEGIDDLVDFDPDAFARALFTAD